jgi:hypothetical protein
MTNPALLDRVSDVIGWGLIHFLWQGTVLAVLLGLTLLVLPRGFARARYVAGCVTLALMLLAPTFTIWQLADPHDPASPYFEDVQASALVAAPTSASELLGDSTTPLSTASRRATRVLSWTPIVSSPGWSWRGPSACWCARCDWPVAGGRPAGSCGWARGPSRRTGSR